MKPRSIAILTLAFVLAACGPAAPSTPTETGIAPTATTPPIARSSPTIPPTMMATPAVESQSTLVAGQWTALFYHDRLGQVILVNGGPDQGFKPADDPLELWGWDGHTWHLLSADGPSWRNWAAVAYDSGRGVLVVHAGNQRSAAFDETWEWDGQVWTRHARTGPGAREGVGMAYDAARGKVVLFGGALNLEILGDTWEWDGQTWTQVATTGPPPRFNADMAYDPVHERVLVYGGHFVPMDGTSDGRFYGDFWAWDGQTWQEIPMAEPNPGVRVATSLVPDPQSGQLLMFGGAGLTKDFLTDLWAWDGARWALLAETGTPPRSGHNVVYDPARGVFVLFGGVDRPGGVALGETWEWDGRQWVCAAGCEARVSSPVDVVLYRGNAQRTGVYAVPAIRQQPSVKWRTRAGSSWLMPPLATDAIVYAGSGDGRLYAFDAQSGEQLWSAGGFEQMESTGAIAGNIIVAGGYSGQVQALDRRNGNVLWAFDARYAIQAAPLIVDAVVYIATDHAVYTLDVRTGELKWKADTGDEPAFMGGPAYKDGVVYTTGGRLLLALDAATGRERWRVERDTPFTALAIANELVYVGNTDRSFRAFDDQTGEERWTFEAGGEFWSAPAVDDDVLYAGNSDRFVYALDANTGGLLWSFETGGEAVSEPVVADGVVYVSDSSHVFPRGPRHLYALDALTGQELWTFETVSTFLPAPALDEGTIYVTTTGEIIALQ